TSAIADGVWEVTIQLTDRAGNARNITAYITVDTTPPTGAQDISTISVQRNDPNGQLWINGTSTDGTGVGVSSIQVVWTNSSASWSINVGTLQNWAFYNTSAMSDGHWGVIIQLTDFLLNSRNISCFIFVDNTVPNGAQSPSTNGSVIQESAQIWINGTASDINGSGVISVSIMIGMGTAPNTWSPNLGTNTTWAFTNTSAILIDQLYWVMVSIIDAAGNTFLLNCSFRIEINPPQGAQDLFTQRPQNGGLQHQIWVNGTAFDGSGIQNVSISWTNITGGASFSINQGNLTHWAFYNTSTIPDGVWTLTITIFDTYDHSINITGIIIVDTIPPTQPNLTIPTVFDDRVILNWAPSSDNTTVTYLIYRNGILLTNTTLTAYMDLNLSPGTYNYTIVPIDAAGNIGPASVTQTVTISEGPGAMDWLIIIIIIIIGVAAVTTATIAIRRRKRTIPPRPRSRPSPEPEKAPESKETVAKIKPSPQLEEALRVRKTEAPKKLDLKFFLIEDEQSPPPEMGAEEEITLEVAQQAPPAPEGAPPSAPKPEVVKPKIVHFTFYCTDCKKWYGLKEYTEVNCPICQKPLKLSYYCPTCQKRYTVSQPGTYHCPRCKTTKLIP
ncbi:MAG: hypothetical protein ACTSRS_15835, partial [Candidatus Helarchaeota archaeon]